MYFRFLLISLSLFFSGCVAEDRDHGFHHSVITDGGQAWESGSSGALTASVIERGWDDETTSEILLITMVSAGEPYGLEELQFEVFGKFEGRHAIGETAAAGLLLRGGEYDCLAWDNGERRDAVTGEIDINIDDGWASGTYALELEGHDGDERCGFEVVDGWFLAEL